MMQPKLFGGTKYVYTRTQIYINLIGDSSGRKRDETSERCGPNPGIQKRKGR